MARISVCLSQRLCPGTEPRKNRGRRIDSSVECFISASLIMSHYMSIFGDSNKHAINVSNSKCQATAVPDKSSTVLEP